jgi:dihydroxy-acid dehydratase
VVELAKRWYEQDDATALPRGIATFEAFENAIALDIAMGGSTNTVLHLLAAAHEAEVDFTMADIDRMSRKVPNLCKVAPATQKYHMEDVHRAGGVIGILAELDRGGLIHRDCHTVHSPTMGEALARWDVATTEPTEAARSAIWPAPAASRPRSPSAKTAAGRSWIWTAPTAASATSSTPIQPRRRPRGALRQHRRGGLHRQDRRRGREHAARPSNCATPPADLHRDSRRAHLREPGGRRQRHPDRIRSRPGRRGLIRYEGPKGGPGMQEMLYPTSYLKSKGLGKACALITDGRFSGGTSGLSIGHAPPRRPRAAPSAGGRGRHHRDRHPQPAQIDGILTPAVLEHLPEPLHLPGGPEPVAG